MTDLLRSNASIMRRRFEGKGAIVTGGGSGMGREFCVLLAKSGVANLSFCDVNVAGLAETEALCRAAASNRSLKLSTQVVDVAKEAAVLSWRDRYVQIHGPNSLHLIVANAGRSGGDGFTETSKAQWDSVFNVIFYGVVHTVRSFLPCLLERSEPSGVIVMSSVLGLYGTMTRAHPQSAYISGKFAVRGFTESLLAELSIRAPHVVVSCVHPGFVGTNIFRGAALPDQVADKEKARVSLLQTARALGLGVTDSSTHEEIASAVAEFVKETAAITAVEASTEILSRHARGHTRILIGADAWVIDVFVRLFGHDVYSAWFDAFFNLFSLLRGVLTWYLYRRPLVGWPPLLTICTAAAAAFPPVRSGVATLVKSAAQLFSQWPHSLLGEPAPTTG
ncbi:putative oxidoreductase SadH [Diplonema papillatum]|nr:putative oxidoreductase SadH [Diplonema papillatum]